MKKTLHAGLLLAALFSLTLPSCGPAISSEDDVVVKDLKYPDAPDTTGGKKMPEQYRELTAPNATEDIKKMQPQM